MIPFLGAEDVRAALPIEAAVDALGRAFAEGGPPGPLRTHVPVPGGDLLLMPAAGAGGVGVKLVTVAPGNPVRGLPLIHGLYVLLSADTLSPVALIDAAALTAVRTAAVSALATRHLARPEAAHLVVVGAGAQARSHVRAMRAVRPVEAVTVISRTRDSAAVLVDELRAEGIAAEVGVTADITTADIVCTCTTSDRPVLPGRLLAPGVHVNAVGAYKPDSRELDTEAMVRARIVVEERAAALAEAGDLLLPIAEGRLRAADVAADLHEVVTGTAVRTSPEDVTVLTSVGLALEDLAVALALVERAGVLPGGS